MGKKTDRFTLLKATFKEFTQAECVNLAASLSYYTVFSLAPMLIVIIALSSMVFGKDAVTGTLFGQIRGMVGNEAAESIQSMIANAYQPKASVIATLFGIIMLVLGSTGVFEQMQYCLNKIWGVKPEAREKRQWLKQIQARFLSFGMVLGVVFVLLVSLAASAALAAFWNYLAGILPGFSVVLLQVSEIIISVACTSALFSLMFKVLPDIKIPWRSVWKGGVVTAVLFEIGKNVIGIYLGKSHVASTYGTAGALVVVMLWVDYSALILFFGASFTKAYSDLHGHHAVTEDYAVPSPQNRETPTARRAA